tara:strand:+ start:1733 stop:3424 length:1692 start_codon:yes stop_codon:yes gene_type:complete
MISSKIKKLRHKFIKFNIDGYVVPKNDMYFNEYSSPDRLEFISNFNGSAGLAIILRDRNYLFVDGRYTIQAKSQSGKNFKIVEIHKKLPWKVLKHKIKIGYNPYCFTSLSLRRYFKNYFVLVPIYSDLIIKNEQRKTNKKFYFLEDNISGENFKSKISKVLKFLRKDKSDCLFVTAPENVAWLLNLRGEDNPHSPIPNCRLILKKNGKIYLFANKSKIRDLFSNNNLKKIKVIDENNTHIFLKELNSKKIILDRLSCCLAYENIIKNEINISDKSDPIYNLKSIKNNIEIKNFIKSHILDAVAVIKFLYWIKNLRKNISELDAEKKLNYFRKKNKNYLFPSFNTIAASGPNGAIIHYRANKKTNRLIKKNDIFLFDSGGQYKYGTTDITRTISLGKQSKKIKNIFSNILKGHISVASANLDKLKSAHSLDILARKFLKKDGLDYPHGTGHGVGYFLNVHEGPIAISRGYKIMLRPGHVISNEPGFYKKGKFGIRLENMIYVKKSQNKMYFKNLTMVPFDKELINFKLLTKKEKDYLMNYNLEIYSNVKKYLTYEEKFWLLSQF